MQPRSHTPRLVMITASLLVGLTGCFNLNADLFDEQVFVALDNITDRPRVLAINLDPPLVVANNRVNLSALVLGPSEGIQEGGMTDLSFDICGLREDVPVDVLDLGCFLDSERVEQVGTGQFARWQVPELPELTSQPECNIDLGGSQALDGRCVSWIPLRATATWGNDSTPAYGVLDVPLITVPGARFTRKDTGSALDVQAYIEGPEAAWPGDVVNLTLHTDADLEELTWFDYQWYATDGTLWGTGLTVAQDASPKLGGQMTTNRLQIPEDASGTLQVAVVYERNPIESEFTLVGDLGWRVHTIEVLE